MYTHITTAKGNTPGTEQEQQVPRGYIYFDNTQTARAHHFYISQPIEDPMQYVEMIHTLKTASPDDVVYIYLNTPGGRLDTTLQIINAMRISQAKIITALEAEAHSAGTMLFLCADEYIVHENSIMMFHNFSGGAFGKGNEMKLQIDAVVKWFNKMAHDIYYPFLTEKEIQDLIDGKDIWMEAEEIRERLIRMVGIINKQRAQQEREAMKALKQQMAEEHEKAKTKAAAKSKSPKAKSPARKRKAAEEVEEVTEE